MNNKDTPLTPITQEILRVLGALCQELGLNIYFHVTTSHLKVGKARVRDLGYDTFKLSYVTKK